MWTGRVIAALGISVAALLGATGVASASGEAQIPAGHLWYTSSNNTFKVTDTACDGHRVYGKWEAPAVGRSGVVDNRSGCGASVFKRVDLPNGTRLRYWVCVDLAFSDRCSPPVEDPNGA